MFAHLGDVSLPSKPSSNQPQIPRHSNFGFIRHPPQNPPHLLILQINGTAGTPAFLPASRSALFPYSVRARVSDQPAAEWPRGTGESQNTENRERHNNGGQLQEARVLQVHALGHAEGITQRIDDHQGLQELRHAGERRGEAGPNGAAPVTPPTICAKACIVPYRPVESAVDFSHARRRQPLRGAVCLGERESQVDARSGGNGLNEGR
jgi:hypothetical protein